MCSHSILAENNDRFTPVYFPFRLASRSVRTVDWCPDFRPVGGCLAFSATGFDTRRQLPAGIALHVRKPRQ